MADPNSTDPKSERPKASNMVRWIILGIVVIGLAYIAIQKFAGGSSKSIFTQYKPLTSDSINMDSSTLDGSLDDSLDSSLDGSLDSTGIIISVDSLFTETASTDEDESSIGDLFSVNKSYDSIYIEAQDLQIGETNNSKGTLFETLLINSQSDDFKQKFNKIGSEKIISLQSALKIISITGKNILSKTNITDNEEIINTLVEAKAISSIVIADRNGHIVYSTNLQHSNNTITEVFPNFDSGVSGIQYETKDEYNFMAIPIFHTYGRLGTGVLTSR